MAECLPMAQIQYGNSLDNQHVSRQGYLFIASLTIVAAAMMAAAVWYYFRQRAALENAGERELTSIAAFEVRQIASWRRERLGDGRVLQSSPMVRLAKRVLSAQSVQPADRDDLLDTMQRLEREFLYTGAALVDSQGVIRIQAHAAADPARISELGRTAARLSDVALRLYWEAQLGRPLTVLLVPVPGWGGFVLTLDVERSFPILKSWPVPTATGEVFLIREEGDGLLCLSDLRFRSGAAFHFRYPLPQRDLQRTAPGKQLDYRGVTVLQTIWKIPDSTLYLVVKRDLSEIDAPVLRLGRELALVLALIGLANMAGAGFIWRSEQTRIYRERERWLRQMADETPAYLWTSAGDGNGMFINRPLADFVGTTTQLQSRETWAPYIHPDDLERTLRNFYTSTAARSEFFEEHRLRRADGEYRWLAARGRPTFTKDGCFLHYSGSLLDVTEHKLAEQNLQAANAALARELEEKAKAEKQIQVLNAELLKAQEEERSRLARELHDDFGQQIAALSIALGNLKRAIPADLVKARSQSEHIREKLADLAENTRRLAHELHPAILQHCTLDVALRALCWEFSQLAALNVTFECDGSFREVSATVALCAYRVTQEALQNIIKHAGTDAAVVALERTGDAVVLTVSDRGVGMDLNQEKTSAALGLRSMRERVRSVRGTLEIRSAPNQGTAITVLFPLTA